jgi:hypothetical protein
MKNVFFQILVCLAWSRFFSSARSGFRPPSVLTFPSKFAFSRLVFLLPPPPSSCCIFPQSVSVLSVIDQSARLVVTLQHRNFSRSLFLFPRQVRQSMPPGVFYANDFPRGLKDWCTALFLAPAFGSRWASSAAGNSFRVGFFYPPVVAPVHSLSLATISQSLAQARTCFPSISPRRESAAGAQPESGFGSLSL